MTEFSDLKDRMKQKLGKGLADEPTQRNFEELHLVRARILGVLLRDARIATKKTEADLAAAVGVPLDTVLIWELGSESPSLAQLEVIAYYLGVPVSHFWRNQMMKGEQASPHADVPAADYATLRDRVLGIRLVMARQAARLSREEVAALCGITAEQVAAFEAGGESIPFPILSLLASAVRQNMAYFLEDTGRVGSWLRTQEQYERFCELPEALQAFVSAPVNQPFLEIALRLSKMPLGELRTVAEKILDITL